MRVSCSVLIVFLIAMASMEMSGAAWSAEDIKATPEPIAPIKAPFPMPQLTRPVFPALVEDIRDHGAIGDGKTLCTKAFAKAIETCARQGGGRVLIPKGVWLTGPIHLKSNIELRMSEGAEVRFSQRYEHYLPVVLIQRGGVQCYNYSPLIYAIDCENIAVTGPGTLDGQGRAWWEFKNHQPGMDRLFAAPAKGIPIKKRVFGTVEDGVRPPFLQFFRCKNILLEGFTIKESPSWCLHPVYCENVIVRKLRVLTEGAPNGDGIDPDSCKNFLIEHCYFANGDDCVILKAGRDEEAWQIGIPCENIVVRHCHMKTGHAGFGIGSEMSAGVRNVFVHDCHLEATHTGVNLKSKRGRGGVVENVWLENIHIGKKIPSDQSSNHFADSSPQRAIRISLYYGEWDTATKAAPVFRNLYFRNITGYGSPYAMEIRGLRESPIKNVQFHNVKLTAQKGLVITDAKGLTFKNFQVHLQEP
ncbi:MAG: glycoside hydrolase family 28 protein [Pirellulales bacterium]|nr:glycoside hydrolase family 28 protein [Pirellulales bacterium]